METIVEKIISENLIMPVNEFCDRPGKNIRSKVVEIGFHLGHLQEPIEEKLPLSKIESAGLIVELIHNGSLIVDDVQDGSLTRRNGPALHLIHGVPLAINAGNWLYFHALTQIKNLHLEYDVENNLINDVVLLMLKAHTGQAIDLGTDLDLIPQDQIQTVCRASMELKTGALMSLAMRLGTAIAGAPEEVQSVSEVAVKMGVLLQILDDAGNLLGGSSKKYEDIILRRPTWIWSVASESTAEEYAKFVTCSKDVDSLLGWMSENEFEKRLEKRTQNEITHFISWLDRHWGHTHPYNVEKIKSIINILEKSYVH